MSTNAKVFVYGSLKRGFGNHRVLGDSKMVAMTTTRRHYHMLSYGAFPGVLDTREGYEHFPVDGEVYEVDSNTLRDLDRLEGNGHFYQRKLVRVSGVRGKVWMYFLIPNGGRQFSLPPCDPVGRKFVWKESPSRRF